MGGDLLLDVLREPLAKIGLVPCLDRDDRLAIEDICFRQSDGAVSVVSLRVSATGGVDLITDHFDERNLAGGWSCCRWTGSDRTNIRAESIEGVGRQILSAVRMTGGMVNPLSRPRSPRQLRNPLIPLVLDALAISARSVVSYQIEGVAEIVNLKNGRIIVDENRIVGAAGYVRARTFRSVDGLTDRLMAHVRECLPSSTSKSLALAG